MARKKHRRGPDGRFLPSAPPTRKKPKKSAPEKPAKRRDSRGRFVSAKRQHGESTRPAPKSKPHRGAGGRFVSKRQASAIKASKASVAARKKRGELKKKKTAVKKAPRLRGPNGRFVSKRQAAALKASAANVERRRKAAETKAKRAEAARKGWERRKQDKLKREAAARAKWQARRKQIAPLITFFEQGMWWVSGWWEDFGSGNEGEGQGLAGATNDNFEDRLLDIGGGAIAVADDLPPGEVVWWSAGVVFSGLGEDDYSRYGGESTIMTYARRASALPLLLRAAAEIGENLVGVGGKISGIIIAASYTRKNPSE